MCKRTNSIHKIIQQGSNIRYTHTYTHATYVCMCTWTSYISYTYMDKSSFVILNVVSSML